MKFHQNDVLSWVACADPDLHIKARRVISERAYFAAKIRQGKDGLDLLVKMTDKQTTIESRFEGESSVLSAMKIAENAYKRAKGLLDRVYTELDDV